MKTIKNTLILVGLLALVFPVQAQIAPGKSIRITIQGIPPEERARIDGNYPVSESGTINMPFLGLMKVSGMRPDALATSLQRAYVNAEIYTNPTFQVVATGQEEGLNNHFVHLGGRIRKAGPIPHTNTLTFYQAVQQAGGVDDFGSMKKVRLFRDGKYTTYDLTTPEVMNMLLQPDDVIDVPQAGIFTPR